MGLDWLNRMIEWIPHDIIVLDFLCLLVITEEMKAKMNINQEKMDTILEEMTAVWVEMKACREVVEVCLERTEANQGKSEV